MPGSPFTCIVGPSGGNAPPNARARGPTLRSAPRGHNAEIQLTGFSGIVLSYLKHYLFMK